MRQLGSVVREHVGGRTEDVLRDEVISAAHTQERLVGRERRVTRDVDAGVAGPDHKNAFARELARVAIRVRVADLAVELTGPHNDVRLPRHAVRADQVAGPNAPAVAQLELPTPVSVERGTRDTRVELDMTTKVVVIGVGTDVVEDLAVVRVVRVLLGHREIGEARKRLRGDEVRGLVHRRAGRIDVPNAADVGIAFEHRECGVGRGEATGHTEPRRAGADNRHIE